MNRISQVLPLTSPIGILDLGAMHIPTEDRPYSALMEMFECSVVGVDALGSEVTKLRQVYTESPQFLFTHAVLGDGSVRTFYKTKFRSTSSIYRPNRDLCDRFQAFGEYLELDDQVPMQTVRLEDLPLSMDVDFIKLDLQGAEYDAITNGKLVFDRAVAVETEVEFVQQYVDQPMFADVDVALRRLDYMFHCFLGYGTRALKPLLKGNDIRRGFRQWLWADAVYIPSLPRIETLDGEKLLKLAAILHTLYHSFDFAYAAVSIYDQKLGSRIAQQYFDYVTSEHPDLSIGLIG